MPEQPARADFKELEILEFVETPPTVGYQRRSKWDAVIAEVRRRNDGKWAVVSKPNAYQQANIRWLNKRAPDLEVRTSGEKVYLRIRPANGNSEPAPDDTGDETPEPADDDLADLADD